MINIIFDMDGTLINSANAISCAVNEIRADLNLAPLEPAFIMQTINTPGKDWAKILYDIDEFEHSSFKDGFERYFVKHYQKSVILYEGVFELLGFLREQNCFLAIATNAPQSSLSAILAKFNILPFFDTIMGVSAGVEPKPSPMMLELIHAKAAYKKSVFVGDSQKDKEAAKRANMPYLHAKWGEANLKPGEFSKASELKALLSEHF